MPISLDRVPWITHDLGKAVNLVDRIVLIEHGSNRDEQSERSSDRLLVLDTSEVCFITSRKDITDFNQNVRRILKRSFCSANFAALLFLLPTHLNVLALKKFKDLQFNFLNTLEKVS